MKMLVCAGWLDLSDGVSMETGLMRNMLQIEVELIFISLFVSSVMLLNSRIFRYKPRFRINPHRRFDDEHNIYIYIYYIYIYIYIYTDIYDYMLYHAVY